MKNLFFSAIIFLLCVGISFSGLAQRKHNAVRSMDGNETRTPKFIESIEITRTGTETSAAMPVPELKSTAISHRYTGAAASGQIEKTLPLQFKYGQLLNKEVETITNIPLYSFIDDWMDTRYHFGGTTKRGIDCSAFSAQLVSEVYAINLPRTAREQYSLCSKISTSDLKEGDLLFFNTRGGVSHVAVYLGGNYFVHASTSNGVMISSLDEPYYSRHFIGGGRIVSGLQSVATKNSSAQQECND